MTRTNSEQSNSEPRDVLEQILDDFYDGVFIEELPKAKAAIQALLDKQIIEARIDELELTPLKSLKNKYYKNRLTQLRTTK